MTIRKYWLIQISDVGPLLFARRLSTVSMLPSSFSGSSGGLSAGARTRSPATAASGQRLEAARGITGYHSAVTLAPRRRSAIATYNIHRCRGMDRRTRPERIAAVLRDIDADVVALQEVIGAGPHDGGHAEELGAALGMGWVMAPARQLRGHQFGNAVLSRLPITQHIEARPVVEDVRRRAACSASTSTSTAARCTSTTCTSARRSSSAGIRRGGWRRSSSRPARRAAPKIVLGDFNEWMRGLATHALSESLKSVDLRHYLEPQGDLSRPAPGPAPDHIYYAGAIEFTSVERRAQPLLAVASDHLPLVADILL